MKKKFIIYKYTSPSGGVYIGQTCAGKLSYRQGVDGSRYLQVDKTTGELKLNYKPLHDLAMFIYNYEKTKSKEENGITKEEDILERKLTLEYLRNCLSGRNNEVKTKTRTKSKEIEGQINLF